MGQHDARLCHQPVNGPSLRLAIYTVPTRALLDSGAKLERVESSFPDKYSSHVSSVNPPILHRRN